VQLEFRSAEAVRLRGTAISADLGGSSNQSSERRVRKYRDRTPPKRGRVRLEAECAAGESVLIALRKEKGRRLGTRTCQKRERV